MPGGSAQHPSQSKFEDPYGADPYAKGKNWDENGDFDSSDSGIGQPKNGRGTIRPAGRAARRAGGHAASSMGGSINGANIPYNIQKVDPYNTQRQRIPSQGGSMRKGSFAP